jgi:ribose transport system permease protein
MSTAALLADVPKRRRILLKIADLRAWLFLALLIVFFEVWAQIVYGTTFIASLYNVQSITIFAVAPLLMALGQTLVIISAGIDLSVGFTMGLSSVIAAHVINIAGLSLGLPDWLSMLIGIVAGSAIALVPGAVNGWLVARLRVPPFIGTLGMYGIARGAAYLLAGGTTVPVSSDWFAIIGNGRLGPVPIVVLIAAVIVLAMHYLLAETRFGQHTYAIGASRNAAVRAGIDWHRHQIWLYILSSLTAGFGGVLYAARFSAGAPQAGEPLLLDSIAAVVIGGASLLGGSGTIAGTVAGALVIALIQYGLVFINVAPFWQFVAVGLVIIVSVLVDQSQRRLLGGHEDE